MPPVAATPMVMITGMTTTTTMTMCMATSTRMRRIAPINRLAATGTTVTGTTVTGTPTVMRMASPPPR